MVVRLSFTPILPRSPESVKRPGERWSLTGPLTGGGKTAGVGKREGRNRGQRSRGVREEAVRYRVVAGT